MSSDSTAARENERFIGIRLDLKTPARRPIDEPDKSNHFLHAGQVKDGPALQDPEVRPIARRRVVVRPEIRDAGDRSSLD